MKYPPYRFLSFLRDIAETTGEIPHIVAGQAINVWAEIYREAEPELENYLPYTSGDLELFQNHIPKSFSQKGNLKKSNPFSKVWGPDSASFSYTCCRAVKVHHLWAE